MKGVETRLTQKRKMRMAVRCAQRHGTLPPAWFLTDPDRTPDPIEIMRTLPRGFGVIYRHFGAADRMDTAMQMKAIAAQRKLLLLASYDPEMLRLDLDGIHWPRWSWPVARHHRPHGLMTTSAHSHRQISQTARMSVDAVFVSSLFKSKSHSAPAAMGLRRYALLNKTTRQSLIALGGINALNVQSVSRYSAFAGVEAIADIFEN